MNNEFGSYKTTRLQNYENIITLNFEPETERTLMLKNKTMCLLRSEKN